MTYVISNEAARTSKGDFLPCGDGDGHLEAPDGSQHRSRGIAQINVYYHPEVSDEEAHNVDFSLQFLATYLKQGKGSQWTTFRKFKSLYPSG